MSTRAAGFDYQRYLASREWALLKEQVRARCRGRCERCIARPYEQTHHITYENIGHEDVRELAGLCHECHEYLSGKRDRDPRGFQFWNPHKFPAGWVHPVLYDNEEACRYQLCMGDGCVMCVVFDRYMDGLE